jgi:hypothetical protein
MNRRYAFRVSGAVACFLLFGSSGCDRATTNPQAGSTEPGRTVIRVDRDGASVNDHTTESIENKRPVNVEVKPGGGVDVNVDRGAIRDKVEERRREQQEQP